jgi:hypothetical protein
MYWFNTRLHSSQIQLCHSECRDRTRRIKGRDGICTESLRYIKATAALHLRLTRLFTISSNSDVQRSICLVLRCLSLFMSILYLRSSTSPPLLCFLIFIRPSPVCSGGTPASRSVYLSCIRLPAFLHIPPCRYVHKLA